MRINFFAVTMALALLSSCNQPDPKLEISFQDVSPRGYSNSAVVKPSANSSIIYISGQVAVNESGEIVGAGNLEMQTEQVFKNIKAQIEKAGGTMNNLVSIECYFTDLSKVGEFRTARDKYINLERPPVSTAVEVKRLVNEDFLIEVNAIAVVDQN